MKIGNDWRNRLWAGGMVALAAAGTFIWWWRDRPMPLDHLADVAAITQKFEEIVFQSEHGGAFKGINKWAGRIILFPKSRLPEGLRAALETSIATISYLSGLEIVITDSPKASNLVLYFSNHKEFRNIASEFVGQREEQDATWTDTARCYFFGTSNRWIQRRGLIVVGNSLTELEAKSCLLEELYQGIGPGKNSRRLRYTVSHGHDNLTELSLNDKLILRALYDDRIYPGMPRAEAMAVARNVINELHAAVRARGPAALIHPRHAARQVPQSGRMDLAPPPP
jgi:hypothetical protein